MAKVLLIVLRKHKHVLNSEKTLVQQNEAVKPSHIRLHIKIGSMRGVECSTILPMPAFKIFLNSFLGKIAFSSRPILRKLYKIFVWEFQIRENVKFDRSTQPLSAPAPRRCGDGRLQFQSCSLEPVARTRDVGLAAAVASRLVLVGAMMRNSGCDAGLAAGGGGLPLRGHCQPRCLAHHDSCVQRSQQRAQLRAATYVLT